MNFLATIIILLSLIDIIISTPLRLIGLPYAVISGQIYYSIVIFSLTFSLFQLFKSKNNIPSYLIYYLTCLIVIFLLSTLIFNGYGFINPSNFINLIKQLSVFIFPLIVTFAIRKYDERNFLFSKYINKLPLINIISFLVLISIRVTGILPSTAFVYSSSIPLLSFYVSLKKKNIYWLLITLITILFSFKKSLAISFGAGILSMGLVLLFRSKFIDNLLKLRIKFMPLIILISSLLLAALIIYENMTSYRNNYIVDLFLNSNLSLNNTSLIETFDTDSENYLTFYQLSSGRAQEYGRAISNWVEKFPYSIFLGQGYLTPFTLYDLNGYSKISATLHSSFLQILISVGLVGNFIFLKYVGKYFRNDPHNGFLIISYLFYGCFSAISFDIYFSLALVMCTLYTRKKDYSNSFQK